MWDVSSLVKFAFSGPDKWFQCLTRPVRLAGVPGWLMRSGFTSELGYEFFLGADEDEGQRVWDALRQAQLAPIGLDAIEKLRIEFGLRSQANDYFPGVTDPYELSMDAYVDLDHAFIGRDACLGVASRPGKRYKTLVFGADDPLPTHLAPVLRDGIHIGDIRSAQNSPRFGTLALAVLRAFDAVDGSQVEVGGRRATVRPVPLDLEKRPAAAVLGFLHKRAAKVGGQELPAVDLLRIFMHRIVPIA
jgi:aminomethyltransferase